MSARHRAIGLRRLAALAGALLLVGSSVGAQFQGGRVPTRGASLAALGDFDGGFQFC